MDKETATYSSQCVCEKCEYDIGVDDLPNGHTYIGYDINQWIRRRLNRTPWFIYAYELKHACFIASKTNTYSARKKDPCLLL